MRRRLLLLLLRLLARRDDSLIARVDADGVVWVPAEPESLIHGHRR